MEGLNSKLSNSIQKLVLLSASVDSGTIFYDEFEQLLINSEIRNPEYWLILNLIDFYEDALHHNFNQLHANYSMIQAKKDLMFISKALLMSSEIILPDELYKRLYKLSL